MITYATQFTWKVHTNWKLDTNIRTKKNRKDLSECHQNPTKTLTWSQLLLFYLLQQLTTYNTITRTNFVMHIKCLMCFFFPQNRSLFLSHIQLERVRDWDSIQLKRLDQSLVLFFHLFYLPSPSLHTYKILGKRSILLQQSGNASSLQHIPQYLTQRIPF